MGQKKRRSSKIGLPPGALVHMGEQRLDHPRIELIEYGPDNVREARLDTLAADRGTAPPPVTWLNVHGLHEPELLAEIGRRFKLHPLVLEDILNTDQRPKVEDYGDYLFLVAHFFSYDAATMTLSSDQVSMVIGSNFVLTFQERPTGNFNPIRERIRQDRAQMRRQGADYLAYCLLDTIVDRYFAVLEAIGERAEELEELLLDKAGRHVLENLHHLKREALALRRAVWPLREVINALTREHVFFKPETQPYLRDIYDHTVHVIESLEAIRDLIAGLLDIYLSTVSNRVNQEVRVLTVIALIFLPSTLLAGIFGMNFKSMPLIDNPSGFVLVIGLMLGVATTLGIIFWRRKWLG